MKINDPISETDTTITVSYKDFAYIEQELLMSGKYETTPKDENGYSTFIINGKRLEREKPLWRK